MMRWIAILGTLFVASCMTPEPAARERVAQAGGGDSEVNPATATERKNIVIRGCCTFASPPGSTVRSLGGQPIDGFPQYEIIGEAETVRVEPFLGAYGWLDAEDGNPTTIDGYAARRLRSADGISLVVPLRVTIDGRETLMSLRIRTDCQEANCPAFEELAETANIESRWVSQ